MAHKRKQVENLEQKVMEHKKKYVRIAEGAQLYSMGTHSFRDLAGEAKAIIRVKGIILVNIEILDEYLELFREEM